MQKNDWFTEARFGMFIHWGLYSMWGRGEQVFQWEKIPKEEYEPLAKKLRPKKNMTEEWIALAKESGMKYAILGTRHHDTFCLFDTKFSEFNSPKTIGRDIISEFVDACRKVNLRVGLYYSLLDYRCPAYFAGPKKDPSGWKKFLEVIHGQVNEICSNYGKIDILWYDGEWPYSKNDWQSEKLNKMVCSLQSGILINDRSAWPRGAMPEDFTTPEQIIAQPKELTTSEAKEKRKWESCMTVNNHWSFYPGDKNWKSTAQLIHNLVTSVSKGGNYLLDIGPQPNGTVPKPVVKRLKEIGAWLKANGDSIYGAGQSSLPYDSWHGFGPLTAKGKKVYFHFFYWPPEKKACLDGLGGKIKEARYLATKRKLKITSKGSRLFLENFEPLDEKNTVVEMVCLGSVAK